MRMPFSAAMSRAVSYKAMLMVRIFSARLGPIISTMALIILMTVIGTLEVPLFDAIKPYLFTTHMSAWRSFFEEPLPAAAIRDSILFMLGHIVFFLSAAVWYFNRKDILS